MPAQVKLLIEISPEVYDGLAQIGRKMGALQQRPSFAPEEVAKITLENTMRVMEQYHAINSQGRMPAPVTLLIEISPEAFDGLLTESAANNALPNAWVAHMLEQIYANAPGQIVGHKGPMPVMPIGAC